MPTYEVTDPRTGQRLRLRGDSPPTEAELENIFRTQVRDQGGLTQAEREQRIASLDAERQELIPEPISSSNDPRMGALTLGSSIVAEPASGIAGLFAGLSGVIQRDVERKMNRLGIRSGPTTDPLARAANAVETTRDALTIDPPNEASERALELFGVGAQSALETARLPVAGLSGLAQLPLGIEQAADVTERVREEGIGPVAGQGAEQLGAPPILSTLIETTPTAIATIAGAGPASRTTSAARSVDDVSVGRPRLDEPVDFTPQTNEIIANIRRTSPEGIDVAPDPSIIESALRLGIDLNVEHYATNSAFQSVARALKSQPGSALAVAEGQALTRLANSADDLVTEIGGWLDRGALSDDVVTRMRSQIDELQTTSNRMFSEIENAIPPQTRINTQGIRDFLDQRIADLGGDLSQLTGPETRLLNMIENSPGGSVTYFGLNRVRREIGEGFNNLGEFAGAERQALGEIYSLLSDAQSSAVTAFSPRLGQMYLEANGIVQTRIGLQEQITGLFGRQVNGSLAPNIRSAALNLPKGDLSQFRTLINSIPENMPGNIAATVREEVAATVLSEIFGGRSRQGGPMGTGFAQTWRAMNRNRSALDELMQYLPEGSLQTYDDIGRVLDGIVRSNARPLGNPSGSAGPIIRALEDGSIATRLYTAAQQHALGRVTGVGPALRLIQRETPANRVQAADEFLNSQAFKDAVSAGLEGNMARANSIAGNSPQFRRWLTTLPDNVAEEVTRVGVISWLSGEQ
jgi:hypothetical protein